MTAPAGAAPRTIVRMLVVDDAIGAMTRVRDLLLLERDVHVHGARDAAEAMTLIESASFDVILVDMDTWDRDSGKLIAAARAARCNIPAMVLYGQDDSVRVAQAMKAGASGAIERRLLSDPQALASRVAETIAGIRAGRRRETLARWMEREARFDHLTGLANRRVLDEKLSALMDGGTPDEPLSVIVLDIDGLGVVNRAFGHPVGDEVLRRAAGAVARCVRASDLASRAGGDELAVILPGASMDVAQMLARRIGHEIERLNNESTDLPPLAVLFAVVNGTASEARSLFTAALEQTAVSERRPVPALAVIGRSDESDPGVA